MDRMDDMPTREEIRALAEHLGGQRRCAKLLNINERTFRRYCAAPGTKSFRRMPSQQWDRLRRIAGW